MFKTRFAHRLAIAIAKVGLPALEAGDIDFFWSNLFSVSEALHYLEMRAIRAH